MKRMILIAAGLAIMLSAAAQPGGDMPQQKRERPSVKEEAQMKTDQMAAELPLNEKQVKKVFKFYKRDIRYRRENFEFNGPRPDGNFPSPPGGRDGFSGGGPGGHRSGGGPEGMGPGGRDGFSGGGHGGPGGMRPGNPPSGMPGFGEIDIEKLEKFNAKQDKKLRKIIGDENFERWRAAHPQQMPKMPEFPFSER